MDKMKSILEQMVPYILIGIVIAILVGTFILFSHLLLWGIVIGAVMWAVVFIKGYFFPSKPKSDEGRIIEHEKDH